MIRVVTSCWVSELRLRCLSIVMASVGLGISLYLGLLKITNSTAVCRGVGDCETVMLSRYAEIWGIPIAFLGVLGYSMIAALLLYEHRIPHDVEGIRLVVFGLALIGSLYSAYLTYIEMAILQAICPYCLVSAIAMGAILIMSILRLHDDEITM
jgi:uncharacterized membrane protein